MEMDLIGRAREYAIKAHGDQKRKYTGEPYWHHLQEVATILLRYSATADVVAAGWLHDVLEDTNVRYGMIANEFGAGVADLVLEVTDVSRPEHGLRPIRKRLDRQYLAGASWRGQMIKCADTISNTRDIVENDRGFASKVYIPEKLALMPALTNVRQYCFGIWKEASDGVVRAEQELLCPTSKT
ncbi:HD domain-containing protein [Bradyrhizobium sp. DASA03007]|uniref:HD domain-containing protein n=1 Tax=unclassified Bradyrhizobium TaxID=2631580 RepID=UPI003F6F2E73